MTKDQIIAALYEYAEEDNKLTPFRVQQIEKWLNGQKPRPQTEVVAEGKPDNRGLIYILILSLLVLISVIV